MKYQFVDNKGRKIKLDGSATMEDLVKIGIIDIALGDPGSHIQAGWYRKNGSMDERSENENISS